MNNRIWETQEPRRAVVTGASGGLGEAFARVLAEEGWDLALVGRNEEELNRVAGILHARHGVWVFSVALDLTARDAGRRLRAALERRGFVPDVLINNAGAGLVGRAVDLPPEAQLSLIDLNARAAVELTLRFLPQMAERGQGGVLNVVSLAGFAPGPHMAVYSAAKAALLSFTEALAEEMAGTGLTISAFCPGMVRTAFPDRSGMNRTWLARLSRPATPLAAARTGWQGFKEGRRIVMPGAAGALAALFVRFAPRVLTRKILNVLLAPRRPRRKKEKRPGGSGFHRVSGALRRAFSVVLRRGFGVLRRVFDDLRRLVSGKMRPGKKDGAEQNAGAAEPAEPQAGEEK